MLMRVETSEEHGHLWQPKQTAGYWSSPDGEEEIFPGREQRNANLMFYSSEEEATMKRVDKHMPNPEEEEEEEIKFTAGSKRKANSWIFNSSDEEEATAKRVKKHMPDPEEEELIFPAGSQRKANPSDEEEATAKRLKNRMRKGEEVIFPAGSQRKANSWIFYSSDEEEATTKRAEKDMANSMEEKGGSAASKHGGGCKISNCKARPKDEDTTKAVRKHKSKYNKRRRLVLKRKAEKRKEIMNKIAEARKHPSEDIETTRMFCQQASYYYNRKHHTDFVLREPLMANMVDLENGTILYHVNFTAKRHVDRDARLFFAEVEEDKRLRVHVCTILDGDMEIETSCRGCAPELMLQHPAGGFDKDCQMPYFDYFDYTSVINSDGEFECIY